MCCALIPYCCCSHIFGVVEHCLKIREIQEYGEEEIYRIREIDRRYKRY